MVLSTHFLLRVSPAAAADGGSEGFSIGRERVAGRILDERAQTATRVLKNRGDD